MKKTSNFLGQFFTKTSASKVNINVPIIEYQEDEMFYAYCPPLDLIGYGLTETEARESWETILCEYLQYGLNKKTLFKDLESRGWKIRKKHTVQPPAFSWMLQNYDELGEIYNNHNFKKSEQSVTMPLAYA